MSAVTVHLFGVTPSCVPAALLRMALDRRPLRRTPGLRFFKLVGTGNGDSFTTRDANPRRWGLIAAWADPAAAADFDERSAPLRAWRRLADEEFRLELQPLRVHGTWAGQRPFAPAAAPPRTDARPVAALTRARITWRHARRFRAAVPPVSQDLRRRPGLRLRLAFGEAPIGLQGTLSVWDSAAALRAFAYGGTPHREAIRQTEEVGWYAEELFARFAVTGWHGTLDGSDPLADVGTGPTGTAGRA